MKKVLALSGPGNSGKTNTIRMAYELLLREYPQAQQVHLHNGKSDVSVILTVDGSKVGIESQGDPSTVARLKASLDRFVKEECVVIVCATRTNGITVEAVNNLSGTYTVVTLQQTKRPPEQQQSSNQQTAGAIASDVKEMIEKHRA